MGNTTQKLKARKEERSDLYVTVLEMAQESFQKSPREDILPSETAGPRRQWLRPSLY